MFLLLFHPLTYGRPRKDTTFTTDNSKCSIRTLNLKSHTFEFSFSWFQGDWKIVCFLFLRLLVMKKWDENELFSGFWNLTNGTLNVHYAVPVGTNKATYKSIMIHRHGNVWRSGLVWKFRWIRLPLLVLHWSDISLSLSHTHTHAHTHTCPAYIYLTCRDPRGGVTIFSLNQQHG